MNPEANRDVISSLPDAILCHIMSFLSTKDAVKTSILCRRCKYTWISVPNLSFNDYEHNLFGTDHFVIFVNRVLNLRQDTIKSFSLSAENFKLSSVLINQWIFSAIIHKVEELKIKLHDCNVQLAQALFCCDTIKTLRLQAISFQVPEFIRLPNLKVLDLDHIYNLEDANLKKILSFSPVLEELFIGRYIAGYDLNKNLHLHLQSASLKSLKIRQIGSALNDHLPTVEIEAPKLEYLELISDQVPNVYKINEMPLLVKAIVDVPNDFSLVGILRQISRVKALTLSQFALLESHRWSASKGFPSFNNLTHLKVTVYKSSCSTLARILSCTSNLEVLVLISTNFRCRSLDDMYVFDEKKVPPLSLPFLDKLKRIEFANFIGTSIDMEMAEYFLKHATALETVVVKSSSKLSIEKKAGFAKKLIKFPRASRTCQILFPLPMTNVVHVYTSISKLHRSWCRVLSGCKILVSWINCRNGVGCKPLNL